MKKKWTIALLTLTCLLVPVTVMAAGQQITAQLAPHFKLLVKGKVLNTSTEQPIVYNNKTYVPLRLVGESLGYEVKWEGKSNTIEFKIPEEEYPVIKNKSVEVTSIEPSYDVITSLDGKSYLGGINIDFVYAIDKDTERKPVIVMETINKDGTVLENETRILEPKAGTHKDFIISNKFKLPYKTSITREEAVKQMTKDYFYRITIK